MNQAVGTSGRLTPFHCCWLEESEDNELHLEDDHGREFYQERMRVQESIITSHRK